MKKQTALIILDGWGYSEKTEHNAIAKANTPFFDELWAKYPHSFLQASGEYVGLPEGQIGNSEIGHTTIGAGKVIDTDLVRINKAVDSGEFDENLVLSNLFNHVIKNDSALHAVGLIGEGGVHSHQDHLLAFIRLVAKKGVKNLYLHLITDGRDAGPTESIESIKQIQKVLDETGVGKISTICGRYFAMDRDNNWDRLEKFTDLFFGKNFSDSTVDNSGNIINNETQDWEAQIKEFHENDKTDEHIEPFMVSGNFVQENDGIFFFNYRSDRARMLSTKILEKKEEMNLFFVTLTEYNSEFDAKVAFPVIKIETTLAKEISEAGLSQVHLAETEKFPHVTYFLNGGEQKTYEREEHIMLPSNKHIKTHDEAPEMKAEEIADEAVKKIEDGVDFTLINFANPDMVGHTANVPAIISAVEFVDKQLKRVVEALSENGGVAFITADHGNAELNYDEETQEKHTAHTLNVVPAILTDESVELSDGSLADIAPTILKLLDVEKPTVMTGKVLFEEN